MTNIHDLLMTDAVERLAAKTEPLGRLAVLSHVQRHALDATRLSVQEARTNGATWAQIGAALGVSAQAAQQRYRA